MAAVLLNVLTFIRKVYSLLQPYPTQTKYGLPLPPVCHGVISAEQIGNRPILIIGDIHGCYDELVSLVQQAQRVANSKDIFLIFVGDLINKGPKHLEVVSFIRDQSSKGSAAAVRGNHEESLLREFYQWTQNKDYKFSEKYEYLTNFSAEDFNFIQNLPYSLSIPKINSLVVHAGLVPGVPLRHQNLTDLTHMRNVVYKCHLLGPVATGCSKVDQGVAWGTQWKGLMHVYYGHDAMRGLQDLPHATGLDTGCVYGLKLTGILIQVSGERCFISVPAFKKYK